MGREIKIAAGIVLFNPDRQRLGKCIESLRKQVEKIYIFDNGFSQMAFDTQDDILYYTEKKNKGIAYALNFIMDAAKKDGFDWVVTMDQDSIMPFGVIDAYKIEIEQDNHLGIVCPQVVDRRRIYMEVEKKNEKVYVEKCITSASCTSINVWEKIGKFDTWMFIDLVDNDFCKRLRVSGYKILKLNKFVLDQEFGKIFPKSERIQLFWLRISKLLGNQNWAKFSYKKVVDPRRVYYTCRNLIYLNKKMNLYEKVAFESYNCNGYLGFLISFIIPSIFRAEKKWDVVKAVVIGIKDGMKKKVDPWMVKNE